MDDRCKPKQPHLLFKFAITTILFLPVRP